MLAPLEKITGNALRTLCYNNGADLTFTEMTRLNALSRFKEVAFERIKIMDAVPTQIQLAGSREEELEKFLSKFTPENGFEGINFNLGCASKEVINQGIGCAMVKRVSKTQKMVKIVKDYGYNCSIKMRLGMNSYEKEKKAYLNLINNVDADFFIVHAKHGGQKPKSTPDFSVYPECIATGKTIIANGNISIKEQIEYLKEMGLHGVMIGRAAVHDPAIFDRLKGKSTPTFEQLWDEFLKLSLKYNEKPVYKKEIEKRIGKPLDLKNW